MNQLLIGIRWQNKLGRVNMPRDEWWELARAILKGLYLFGLFVIRLIFWFSLKFTLNVSAFILGGLFAVLTGSRDQPGYKHEITLRKKRKNKKDITFGF